MLLIIKYFGVFYNKLIIYIYILIYYIIIYIIYRPAGSVAYGAERKGWPGKLDRGIKVASFCLRKVATFV